MMRRRTVIVLFTLTNLLMCLGLLWGWRGSLAALDRLRTTNRLMESRLAIKERNLTAQATYQQHLDALAAEAAEARVILSYDRVGAALDGVRQSAQNHALTENAFETREPVTYINEDNSDDVIDGGLSTRVAYDGLGSGIAGNGFGGGDSVGGRIVEIKAEVAYTGLYEDMCAFAADLLESSAGYRIDRLTIAVDPAQDGLSNLRLDFYIYAVETGVLP